MAPSLVNVVRLENWLSTKAFGVELAADRVAYSNNLNFQLVMAR